MVQESLRHAIPAFPPPVRIKAAVVPDQVSLASVLPANFQQAPDFPACRLGAELQVVLQGSVHGHKGMYLQAGGSFRVEVVPEEGPAGSCSKSQVLGKSQAVVLRYSRADQLTVTSGNA